MKDETTLIDELKDRVHDLYDENKSLQERLDTTLKTCNNLRDTIDKAIEYIEKKEEILLNCDIDFLDHDELIDRKRFEELLAILRGKE